MNKMRVVKTKTFCDLEVGDLFYFEDYFEYEVRKKINHEYCSVIKSKISPSTIGKRYCVMNKFSICNIVEFYEDNGDNEKVEYCKEAIVTWEAFKAFMESMINSNTYAEDRDEIILDQFRDVLYFLKQ